MAEGLTGREQYFRRINGLALSTLPITELPLAAAAPSHHDGVMVALVPDNPEQLAVEGEDALPPDDLHVTLCYLGKTQDLPDDAQSNILATTQRVVDEVGRPFSTSADGVVVMGKNDDGVPATALLIQANEIVELYDALAEALDYHSDYPSFIPHMTSGYGIPVEDVEPLIGQPISFSGVLVKFGDERHVVPLGSALIAAPNGANTIDRVIDSRGRVWDEGLHPRGGDGEFIKKDGAVSGKVSVPKPGGGVATVEVNRAMVVGFRTVDNTVQVVVEILNEDGTTTHGYANAAEVKAVAQVKARLDDDDFGERIHSIREDAAPAEGYPIE